MAVNKAKPKSPGQPGPDDEVEWAVAVPNPDPREVARRAREEEFQDAIDDFIEARRDEVEAGNGSALLEALFDFCMHSDREMPLWLREYSADAIRRYLQLHTKTLDEAFRLPKRTRFAAKRRRSRHGVMIYFEICALHWAGVSITQELYHAVGDLHNVGRNFVEECYTRELARRGNRRVGQAMEPSALPRRLWPTYERVTGKRIENRL